MRKIFEIVFRASFKRVRVRFCSLRVKYGAPVRVCVRLQKFE